jgi:hypothetical protein
VQRLPDGKNELVEIPYRQFPDDRGQYRSSLLEPGLYYIAIVSQHAPDFWDRTWRSTYYPHALDMESAKAIELSQGQQMRADIQVIRQAGIRVSGRVAVPSHDPPPPGMQIVTRVYLASHGGLLQNSSISSTVTADRFEAVDLLPGTYTVLAETLQMSTDVPARNAKVLFGTLRQVQIGERDISGLDLELQPLPEVTGRVTFADGCTAAPVGVDLQSMSVVAFTQHSAVIGPGGAFAFGTFAPGTLFISATGPGQASVFLGDRDITRSGFDYPTPAPQALRITMSCASGGAQ